MPGTWHGHDSGSNTAPLAFPDQYSQPASQSAPQPAQRYQLSSYHVPDSQPVPNLPSNGVSHHQLSSHQLWAFDFHNQQLHGAHGSQAGYGEPLPPSSSYYADPATSHLVGYPESSQRTHLPETAYGAFSAPYHSAAASLGAEMTSASSHTHSTHLGLETAHSIRQRGRLEQGSAGRPTYGTNNQYFNARSDFEPLTNTHRLGASSDGGLHSIVGGSQQLSSSHANLNAVPMGSPTSPFSSVFSDTSSLTDARPPRLDSYASQLRRDSMESIHDPLSPSAVPSLVYDADTGEDYDDDSEGSPPSAVSELSRSSYHSSSSRGERLRMDINGADEWQRSLDAAYSGTSGAQESDRGGQQPARSPRPAAVSPSGASTAERSKPSQKKSKMHQCTVCMKLFPRPSGLATHMNSHSGAKPYKCPIPTCTKSFAVRSNAKRHLRTHGIFPTSDHANTSPSQFTVGFETPLVSEVHEVGKLPSKLRWVPQSLATRTNVDYLRDPPSDSEEEYLRPSCPLLPVPLPPVCPSSPTWNPDDRYEERDPYGATGASPYLPSQWRGLPGPAIMSATSF